MKDLAGNFGHLLLGDPADFDAEGVAAYARNHRLNATHLYKALNALEYLAQLKTSGLDFVFKGGTAVQLILPGGWQRFSIDLDLQTIADRQTVEKAVEDIHKRFGGKYFAFMRRETVAGGSRWFGSYSITVATPNQARSTILLDVLHTEPTRPTCSTPIASDFYHSSTTVTTPTLEGLFADKLTTLGPHTVGRPLRDSRNGLEYAKHLFDLDSLRPYVNDVDQVSRAYTECVELQNRIRNKQFGAVESARDLRYVCSLYALREENAKSLIARLPSKHRKATAEHFRHLHKGLTQRFAPFLLEGRRFPWGSAHEAGARIALAAAIVEDRYSGSLSHGQAERAWQVVNASAQDFMQAEGLMDLAIQVLTSLPEQATWFVNLDDFGALPSLLVPWACLLDRELFIEAADLVANPD